MIFIHFWRICGDRVKLLGRLRVKVDEKQWKNGVIQKTRLKAAALGTVDVKVAALIKKKMQDIKAAALEPTGMKAAALEYV